MDVREVMSRGVVSIRPDAPLKEAIRLLDRHGISGLPVTDASGTVVGVLSEADILFKEARGSDDHRRFAWLLGGEESARRRAKIEASTVGEAMNTPPVTIGPREPLRRAAALMLERRINRLPVVEGGQLIGILTRADIARAFLRPDVEIERIVREEILLKSLWVDPDSIETRVTEGVVRFSGTTHRRSTVDLIGSLTRQLDGVVGVENELTWTFDDTKVEAPERDLVYAGTGRP